MKNIDTSSWKEFKISDICEQYRGKEASPNKVPDGEINMVNEISSNNGIAKKGFSENVFEAPAITVSVNFAQNVFLQEKRFCASVNILILKADWMKSYPKAALYLTTILRKNNVKYDYSSKISKDRLNNTIIKLPVTESEEIDWDYMQERIEELEQERIEELEQYLVATGLNDYELADEDREVLSLSGFGDYKESDSEDAVKVRKEFKVSDLFIVEGTKSLDAGSLEFKNDGINFVGRTNENNGVQGKINKQSFEPNEANTLTATVIGNYKYVKYQEEPYYCSQNINKLISVFPINKLLGLYFRNIIQKFVSLYDGKQGGYKLDEIKEYTFPLPIQTDTSGNPVIDSDRKYHSDGYIPNWDFMEKYIKTIEKIVIADVVKYKDEMIAKTKDVVKAA